MDHYFYEGEGGGGVGLGLSPKIPAQQKLLKKKLCKESHGEKYVQQVLCAIQVQSLNIKKILHTLLPTTTEKYIHNVNLQVRKKFFMLQKIAYPSPDPPPTHPSHLKKTNGLSLDATLFTYFIFLFKHLLVLHVFHCIFKY